MNQKLLLSLSILLLLTISACQNAETTAPAKANILASENLPQQEFSIHADRDTILIGKSGTQLTIKKNTFVDQNGNPVTGQIDIEFKECLSKLDMVLGNLTTTYKGQALESGGMIYLNATANDQQLAIAKDNSIGVVMPADSVMEGMQLFEGVESEDGINWEDPQPLEGILQEVAADVINDSIVGKPGKAKKSNVGYLVRGFHYKGKYSQRNFFQKFKPVPPELINKISDICWEGGGLIITKDSVIQIDTYEVALIKTDSIQEFEMVGWGPNSAPIQGRNQFREDSATRYIFSIKKLGWANIDRLFNDPRTKQVELFVTVDKYDEFEKIYTSMIFKNQSMYLPGYQKKDNSFSFTHGDNEKTSLPVGETATVLVTAYKGDEPYYALQEFTIQEEQTIALKLGATTKEDLKKALEKQI